MAKCGFFERDITPPLGGNIPGYGMRRPATGIKTPLYSKAVAIEEGGKCVIIISVDAIGLSKEIHDTAVEIIEKATGVPSSNVLIHATHIHTGGPVGRSKDKYPNPHFTPDENYTLMLARAVGDSGVLAYQRLADCTAKSARGELYGISFVRNYVMKDGSIRTNPGFKNPDIERTFGEMDPDLPVLFFFDENGKPKGAMVNFTLHHDCVTGFEYCSDYSGVLAENLKKEFGQDFVTVFVNGTCGNINHFDVSITWEELNEIPPYIRAGNKLTEAVLDLYKKADDFEISVVDGKKELLELTRRDISEEEVAEHKHIYETIPIEGLKFSITNPDAPEYKRFKAEAKLNFALRPKKQSVSIQAIRIGGMMVYAMPGEVYNEFGKLCKSESPLPFNMVAELANDGSTCYVPTPEAFGSPIYESQLPSSEFIPETGEKMARFAVELGKKLV